MSNVDPIPGFGEIHGSDMHIHIHADSSMDQVIAYLKRVMRTQANHTDLLQRIIFGMTDIQGATEELTAQVSAMASRVNEDVNHLQDLLNEALATETANASEVARIKAEAEAAVGRINEVTNAVRSIDPLTNFPDARPSEQEPAVAEPTDEGRGDGPIRPNGDTPPNETPQAEANPS